MSRTMFGTAVGLVLGLVLIFAGFGPMLVVALFGAAGWLVAKIVAGELDLSSLTSTAHRRSPR